MTNAEYLRMSLGPFQGVKTASHVYHREAVCWLGSATVYVSGNMSCHACSVRLEVSYTI
jgi:hypothetical protein